VAYNFGPNGQPLPLSEWGIPVGNNHGSSCGTTGPGEDNLLFLLLFLRFGDGGPTVGNSRHKHVDRRGPALLLLHRGAVRSEKQGMSWTVGGQRKRIDLFIEWSMIYIYYILYIYIYISYYIESVLSLSQISPFYMTYTGNSINWGWDLLA